MADRAVSRSAEEGAFDSLRGAGKPLPRQARHDEQFFTVDATQQAINRYAASWVCPRGSLLEGAGPLWDSD